MELSSPLELLPAGSPPARMLAASVANARRYKAIILRMGSKTAIDVEEPAASYAADCALKDARDRFLASAPSTTIQPLTSACCA